MPPQAILLDFDGVLADTEHHHIAAWQRTLTALGWQVPDEVAAAAAEIDDREFLRDLFAAQGIHDGDIAGWVRRKQELTVAMVRDAPRLYPGVRELIAALLGKTRLAIVSTSWRENIDAVLSACGLAGVFEAIVAKEDVGAVKPDPEAYLLALQRLELEPGDAVAIEDSPSGLAAARAAMIPRIAVGHRREFGPWVGQDVYFTGLEPVSGLLRHLGFNGAET